MTEQPTDNHGPRAERSQQQGEAAPGAASPFTDAQAEQVDHEGRHVDDDTHDNADLDG